jgi:hypothetical protein
MHITFKHCPDLVRVGDIGESIVEADDSFRRQFSILVLAAVRKREIRLRNNNGFRIPQESLDITESQTRDVAKRHVEEKLLPPGGDFDADLQRAQSLLSAQPWIQQHCDIDAKLQAYAKEFEKHKEFIESVVQSETRRLLDDWYRDASVLVSEVAEWFCKTHDFEGHMAAPSNPTDEPIRSASDATTVGYNQLLAICNVQDEDDFGGYVVKKTGIYVKNHKKHHKQAWSMLTPSEKAVLAWHPTGEYDKPALPIPCTLGQLRSFVIEAGLAGCLDEAVVGQLLTSVVKGGETVLLPSKEEHATPIRFAPRAMQDGFDKVTREKAGERSLEARVAAVNLTDERCIQLAHSHELRIADWTALTGIGIGWHWSHVVSAEGVAFRKWTEQEIREASVDQQVDMHHDNEAVPLKFPCAPATLIQFIDAASPGSHSFSLPDVFRQAVTKSEQAADIPPAVSGEPRVQPDIAPSGAIKAEPDEQVEAAAPTENNPKPVPRQQYNEDEILRVISDLGYDAQAIPKWKPGKPGVKKEIRGKLRSLSDSVFKHAWDHLRKEKIIRDAD